MTQKRTSEMLPLSYSLAHKLYGRTLSYIRKRVKHFQIGNILHVHFLAHFGLVDVLPVTPKYTFYQWRIQQFAMADEVEFG